MPSKNPRSRRITVTTKEGEDRTPQTIQPRKVNRYATIGSSSVINEKGEILDDIVGYRRLRGRIVRNAGLFSDAIGGADIEDSQNLQSYNFEFPNDAMELPQSRREEIRYYRIAYDRDPIVGRAIDLSVELPLSKLILEKPKCSSPRFADFVFDWFQGWVNDTNLFRELLNGTREYFLIGESFFFIEHLNGLDKFPLCPVAKRQLDRKERMRGPTPETNNPSNGLDELTIYQWSSPKKAASLIQEARELHLIEKSASEIDFSSLGTLKKDITRHASKLASLVKTAAPEDPPAGADDAPPDPLMASPLESIRQMRGDAPEEGDPGEGGEGDLGEGMDAPPPMDGGGGGMLPPMGGGGGGGLMGGGPEDGQPEVESQHVINLRRYLRLLERKKSLLEELKSLKEEHKIEFELFGHVCNKDFWGPDRIVLIPPDVVEIRRDKRFNSEPTICYRPSAVQKQAYLEDKNISQEDREMLEQDNIVPLNDDPNGGSYIIQFARRKAPFEDHGRSILQRCLRTIIYRDKLRQAQNTLVSRHMTPITLVIAPDVSVQELAALRVHIDEAKHDPDYSIVINYAATWQEIGVDGRLLALESEWATTSAELAVGMGFTPEILTGEGFFSGDRIRLELLNTTYLQFRDILQDLVETQIFRPISMRKGFYEIDDYGNPRWIYPKLSFTRLALRDQGDVYDMLFNLYAKGSLPVDIIYEFLNLDPETCKRKLEEDLLTVKDSKFNQVLDALYSSDMISQILKTTDAVDKVSKSLQLKKQDIDDMTSPEGTGEGV